MVKDLWREVGFLHDFFAGAAATGDSLENFGFDIIITNEFLLREFLMFFEIVLGEEFLQNIIWGGIGEGTLFD